MTDRTASQAGRSQTGEGDRTPAAASPGDGGAPRADERGRGGELRPLGDVLERWLAQLASSGEDLVALRLSEAAANAIALLAARRCGRIDAYRHHRARLSAGWTMRVPRQRAERWRAQAWQAVREGLLDVGEAQAISDQLDPPDAA